MANADHFKLILQGVGAWNVWRTKEPSIKPDLSGAIIFGVNLDGANLSGANLIGANLNRADLRGANLNGENLSRVDLIGANLFGADLSGTDLSGANLGWANLSWANLIGANLSGADLSVANLSTANLSGVDLSGADLFGTNLIDACLDRADLTDAHLWETQCGGWSIKGTICQRAFLDRKGEEPTSYKEGEFERIFAEKPRIVLHYPGGMSLIDLIALPIVLERLQAEHPGSALQVRSMQTEAGGASVTITVEDREGRSPEVFEYERVRIETRLKSVVEERDYLRSLLASTVSLGASKLTEFLALPRQEIHLHRPIGPTTIEGPTTMSEHTYIIPGQAGAVGPGAHAHDNTFQQIQSGLDLPKLVEELGRLRPAMKGEATGTREQDKAIGAVADAEEAATKGDGPTVLRYLKGAGPWGLEIAEKIGVPVLIEILKKLI